jgi:phage shock protein A
VWFFNKSSTGKSQDIEERLETLERAMRALQLDWDDAYDKMRTLTARFTKRAQQIERHEQQEQPENASGTGSEIVSSTLDPVSKRILERRARMFPVRGEKTQ